MYVMISVHDLFMLFTQPPPAQKKHAPPSPHPPPTKVKQQEVGIGGFPVATPPETFPEFFDYDDHDDDDYLEDDSDTDDDDDEVPVLHNGHAKSSSVSRTAASRTRKPVIPVQQKPLPPPTRQPRVIVPGGGVRVGKGVVRGRGGGASFHLINRPSTYMASLPAGCLLSDALIACGSTGLTSLPLIKDAGIRTLYLAGELMQAGRQTDR